VEINDLRAFIGEMEGVWGKNPKAVKQWRMITFLQPIRKE
jgi:hypothetical protein